MTPAFNIRDGGLTILRTNRKPLRTTAELAEEFGVSAGTLDRLLRPSGIKPTATKCSNLSVKKTWYEPGEVRAWWKQRSAA